MKKKLIRKLKKIGGAIVTPGFCLLLLLSLGVIVKGIYDIFDQTPAYLKTEMNPNLFTAGIICFLVALFVLGKIELQMKIKN